MGESLTKYFSLLTSQSPVVTVDQFFWNGYTLSVLLFLASVLQNTFLQNHHFLVIREGVRLRSAIQVGRAAVGSRSIGVRVCAGFYFCFVFVFGFFCWFFFRSPAISLGFTTLGWDFCECDPFFNPTIKVVTFRLCGWCVLGVFLLPAFTRQDMNVRIFWARAMKCMCAQTWPWFILSSERVFGGMEFEPMLTPREKSLLPENFPRGGSNQRHCGQQAQTLPTSYSSPLIVYMIVCVCWGRENVCVIVNVTKHLQLQRTCLFYCNLAVFLSYLWVKFLLQFFNKAMSSCCSTI